MKHLISDNVNRFRPALRRAYGFTLVEMTTSLVVASILFLAMGSAMVVATQAIPQDDDQVGNLIHTNRALQDFTDELQNAIYITESSATSVTFVLPDRRGNGLPEVIHYAWGGTPGDPLTRTANGGSAVAILEDVQSASLAFTTQPVTQTYPGTQGETSEIEFSKHTFWGMWYDIDPDYAQAGQYFVPTNLPADAIDWRVTRALIWAQPDGGNDGQTAVQLRLPNPDGTPADTVLTEKIVQEADLPVAYAWFEINFDDHTPRAPGEGLCLVLKHAGGGDSMRYGYDGGGTGYFWDWKGTMYYENNQTLDHYIYGVATVPPGPKQTLTRDHYTSARVALTVGSREPITLESNIALLNIPEVLTAVWEADFEARPNLIDLDMDGTQDWIRDTAGAFDPTRLQPPIWKVKGLMQTNPPNLFTEPVTVNVTMEDVTNDGEGGGVKMRVDRSGDVYGYIRASTELQGDGTQTLEVVTYNTGNVLVTVCTKTGLTGKIDLQILADPDLETFNLKINGTDHGTYRYGRPTISGYPHVIELYQTAAASGTQIDHVRIRMGGTSGTE